jgi:hypothetical protein
MRADPRVTAPALLAASSATPLDRLPAVNGRWRPQPECRTWPPAPAPRRSCVRLTHRMSSAFFKDFDRDFWGFPFRRRYSSRDCDALARRTTATPRRPNGAGGGENLGALSLEPISVEAPLPATDAPFAHEVERKMSNLLAVLAAPRLCRIARYPHPSRTNNLTKIIRPRNSRRGSIPTCVPQRIRTSMSKT